MPASHTSVRCGFTTTSGTDNIPRMNLALGSHRPMITDIQSCLRRHNLKDNIIHPLTHSCLHNLPIKFTTRTIPFSPRCHITYSRSNIREPCYQITQFHQRFIINDSHSQSPNKFHCFQDFSTNHKSIHDGCSNQQNSLVRSSVRSR
jgi:hypothetical protein